MPRVPATTDNWNVPGLNSTKGVTPLASAAFPTLHIRSMADVTATRLSSPSQSTHCIDYECLFPERQCFLDRLSLRCLSPMRNVITQFLPSNLCAVGIALIPHAQVQAAWSLGKASSWTWDELFLAYFRSAKLVLLCSTADSTVKSWSTVWNPRCYVIQTVKNIPISGGIKSRLYR